MTSRRPLSQSVDLRDFAVVDADLRPNESLGRCAGLAQQEPADLLRPFLGRLRLEVNMNEFVGVVSSI
jgi:hypothetical protein